MEIVLLVELKNVNKVKDIVLKDPVISLATITFKDGKAINKDNFYIYISGLEEQCKKAIELTKDLAKPLEGKEKEEIISIIKEEESRAVEGFGSIFG